MKVTTQSIIPRRLAQFFSGPIVGVMAVLLPLSVAISQSPATVDLGSTANIAVLAGTAATFTSSTINGDIGVSPGVPITMTTSVHNGTTYTGVGSSAGTAQEDLTLAYNDAAGRITPEPTVNPGTAGGEIGGMNLGPGLYKFTSTAAISSDVTLTGSATDVWIFQIGSTLIASGGIDVILAGGAQANNIFWQVGTYATIAASSVFEGTIMANDYITLAAGVTLNGRALARSAAVTSTTNTITVTTDQSLPVTLSAFSARAVKGSVQLNWSTASEIENLGFSLSRKSSTDGQKWSDFYKDIASYSEKPALRGQGSTTEEHDYQYVDELIQPGLFYEYRLSDVDYHGHIKHHPAIRVVVPTGKPIQPRICELGRIYPNPFNPVTIIPYKLRETAQVNVSIFSLQGELIATLTDGEQEAGNYDLKWSPGNLASGIYLARVQAGGTVAVQQVVFIK